MSARDRLLGLGHQPWARQITRGLGLPSLPVELPRTTATRETCFLEGEVVAAFVEEGDAATVIRQTLVQAGASLSTDHDRRANLAVFDASGLDKTGDLRRLHEFFHARVGALGAGGRVLVVGRSPDAAMRPEAAAVMAALEGFVRSLGKELGRKGATANLITYEAGAEARLAGPLRFLAGPRSAFVDLQRVAVDSRVRADPGDAAGPWQRPLAGRNALVTGAARGIGAAIVRVLASEGARVVGLDRQESGESLAAVMEPVGGEALTLNLLSDDAPARVERFLHTRGGVDVVVHNAGITRDKTLAKMQSRHWEEVVAVNLDAVLRLDAALVDGPLQDGGKIVCLSSVSGLAGNFGQTNYAASKAGLVGYVRQLAPRLAGRGINVNAVAPGFIETEMTAAMPAFVQNMARRMSALNQAGKPEDVAELVTFLCTPGACGVTGQVVRVCGGALIGA